MKKVAIVMGSASDMPAVQPAVDRLKKWGVDTQVRVLSAHRTPQEAADFAAGARENGFGAIIAAAGKAAALPGALAAVTTLPVIGLPVKSSFMDGLDSLLSMAQMPPGIPVATVGVNAAENAAILALEIMAVADADAAALLKAHREEMTRSVLAADAKIREAFK
ncbi:MAG: 5-(carboxyamino)imidazole ribonucleotide mutase [Christensenellales bacterium]